MMRQVVFSALIAMWSFAFAADHPLGRLRTGERYVKGRFLVGFDAGRPLPAVGSRFASGVVLRQYSSIGVVLVGASTALGVPGALRQFARVPGARFAEPDYVYHAADTIPDDPEWTVQWGPQRIECQKAWDYTTGSSSVYIAVIDSGVDYAHPDLAANYAGGYDYEDNDTSPMDTDGHGTHVAGIAAAVTNNTLGVAGTAYNCKYMALRVGANNVYPESQIISGINWAVANGAHVINLSLGGYTPSVAVQLAVDDAWNAGVVVCAAAGNDAVTSPFYPAYYTNALAVAATNSANNLASFSNRGSWVDIAAPGTGIYSTYPGSAYANLSGTSSASPMVAGAAALIYSALGGTRNLGAAQAVRESLTLRSIAITGEIGGGRLSCYESVLRHVMIDPSWQTTASSGGLSLSPVDTQLAPSENAAYSLYASYGASELPCLFLTTPAGTNTWSILGFGVDPFRPTGLAVDLASAAYVGGSSELGWRVKKVLSTGAFSSETAPIAGSPVYASGSDGWPVDTSAFGTTLSNTRVDIVGPSSSDPNSTGVLLAHVDPIAMSALWTATYHSHTVDKARFVRMGGLPPSVFVAGTYLAADGNQHILLLRYNSSGTLLFAKEIMPHGPSVNDYCDGLVVSSTKVYVSGRTDGGNTPFLLHYDLSGNLNSSAYPTASGPVRSATVSTSGPLIYLDYVERIGNLFATHVVYFDASVGTLVELAHRVAWIQVPGPTVNEFFVTRMIGNGTQGGVVFYAAAGSPPYDYDAYVIAFDQAGDVLWIGLSDAGHIDPVFHGDLLAAIPTSPWTYIAGREISGEGQMVGYSVAEGGNTATGNVGGQVDLDGYLGGGGLSGTLEFREPGSLAVAYSAPLTLSPTGGYSALDIPAGTYDVSLKLENWLRQTFVGVSVTSAGLTKDFGLLNGDADGDNAVTLFDLNTELVYFGSDGSEGGDLDWDGLVGLFDLNLCLINFGTAGDP